MINTNIFKDVDQCESCNSFIRGRIIVNNGKPEWYSMPSTTKYGGKFCGMTCSANHIKKIEKEEYDKNNFCIFTKT